MEDTTKAEIILFGIAATLVMMLYTMQEYLPDIVKEGLQQVDDRYTTEMMVEIAALIISSAVAVASFMPRASEVREKVRKEVERVVQSGDENEKKGLLYYLLFLNLDDAALDEYVHSWFGLRKIIDYLQKSADEEQNLPEGWRFFFFLHNLLKRVTSTADVEELPVEQSGGEDEEIEEVEVYEPRPQKPVLSFSQRLQALMSILVIFAVICCDSLLYSPIKEDNMTAVAQWITAKTYAPLIKKDVDGRLRQFGAAVGSVVKTFVHPRRAAFKSAVRYITHSNFKDENNRALFIAHGGVELLKQISQVWFIREPFRQMYDLTQIPVLSIVAKDRTNFMSTKALSFVYDAELSSGDFVRFLMLGRRMLLLVKEMMEVKMLDKQHVEGTEIAKKVINEELKKMVGPALFHVVKPLEEFWLEHAKDLAGNVESVNANLADIEVGIIAMKAIMDVYAKDEGTHIDFANPTLPAIPKPLSNPMPNPMPNPLPNPLPNPMPVKTPTQVPREVITTTKSWRPFSEKEINENALWKSPSMGMADIDGGRPRRSKRKTRKATRRRTRTRRRTNRNRKKRNASKKR